MLSQTGSSTKICPLDLCLNVLVSLLYDDSNITYSYLPDEDF